MDIAIDGRNEKPFFTIEQLNKKCKKGEFISGSRRFQYVASGEVGEDTAKTLYIGARGSSVCYRFYDKDKQQANNYGKCLDEIGSWKRTELELRDEKAHAFAQLMAENPDMLGTQIFDLLGSNLRFVVPDKNQANKSRWKTCRFWKRFLGTIQPLKIIIEKPETNLFDTQSWLKYGGASAALLAFLFLQEHDALGSLEDLDGLMNGVRFSQGLSGKVTPHLCAIGRQDLIPELKLLTSAD